MRQGIIHAADFVTKKVPFLLEPDHRIVAEKQCVSYSELLIEGPHMPETLEDGSVVTIGVSLAKQWDGTVIASWSHRDDIVWTVDVRGLDLPI